MPYVEGPRYWHPRDRERSSPPTRKPPPPHIFTEGDIQRCGNLVDTPSPIDFTKIKDPDSLIGYLYEEEYIKHLRRNPRLDRITLTSHVLDKAASRWSGMFGLPDMLEFFVQETQGGKLDYKVAGMAEVRSKGMHRVGKIWGAAGFLKKGVREGFLKDLLLSVGETPGSVTVPKDRREITFTFVYPNPPESGERDVLPGDIPRFALDYLPLPLPLLPNASAVYLAA